MTTNEGHNCHFCGTFIIDGKETNGERHWLSDCRPDLVKHEIGDKCTWPYKREEGKETESCYGYQEKPLGPFTTSHSHFYPDGPM
jgi:hypothetical protein